MKLRKMSKSKKALKSKLSNKQTNKMSLNRNH